VNESIFSFQAFVNFTVALECQFHLLLKHCSKNIDHFKLFETIVVGCEMINIFGTVCL
jgi:hypothetical protein